MKRKSVSILPLCTPSIGAVDKELLVSIPFIKAIQAKYPQTKYYFVEGRVGLKLCHALGETALPPKKHRAN